MTSIGRLFILVVSTGLACLPIHLNACSTHGTQGGQPLTLRADVFGDLDANGFLNARVGIVDGFVAPTSSTTCVAGVGFGNMNLSLPSGVTVTAARIAIVNQNTGAAVPLRDFSFSPNSTTTAGLASGGNGITPLFAGSTWFGFSSSVDPFTLPVLGPQEQFELQFDLEIPPDELPLSIPVQFAAGEGSAAGEPNFFSTHPPGYFTAVDPIARFAAVPECGNFAAWVIVGIGFFGAAFCRRWRT